MDTDILPPAPPPPPPPPPVEDYESLGHTFLGGHRNGNPIIDQTVITQEAREPLDWTRLIWWALGATIIVLAVLAAWVVTTIAHHIRSSHAAAPAGPAHNSGTLFAWMMLVGVVLAAVAWLLRGE